MAVFSAVRGLAVLVNAGIAPADCLDAAVKDVAGRILPGSRTLVELDAGNWHEHSADNEGVSLPHRSIVLCVSEVLILAVES